MLMLRDLEVVYWAAQTTQVDVQKHLKQVREQVAKEAKENEGVEESSEELDAKSG